MKFQKLRLAGFKSFCEATDFLIEPGLTGVVGPNGCGKSNLVEALRWVMGESSYKNMRGSGMEDVIFSGSARRPARNLAEVGITLDNGARTAPSAFNHHDIIEVTRRIEREQGSTYRVNGREVRARDVQLLFADASSGARSPAMVRQGQIGEIIAAKPPARRRILEEAAGVAGLHSRRHEAELRLKSTGDNLARLDDVARQIDLQIDALKRQARQAQRYRALAAEIRRCEALILHISHVEAAALTAQAETALREGLAELAQRTQAQGEAARLQALAAHHLPPLREAAAAAAAKLQRLVLAREALDAEERRARERFADIAAQRARLGMDREREAALMRDAEAMLARLAQEGETLERAQSGARDQIGAAEARVAQAQTAQARSDAALARAQSALAALTAQRQALENAGREEAQRIARLELEARRIAQETASLRAEMGTQAVQELRDAAAAARAQVDALEAASMEREQALLAARALETRDRPALTQAERAAQRLETELRTLEKLFATQAGPGRWPSALEGVTAGRGYEVALGAALGEDLDAALDPAAPAFWGGAEASDDPALPAGAEALADHVAAPQALSRRLRQIGLIERAQAPALRALLAPGQRLVSREGDLWRWDGFCSVANAPSPAARRLAEKNRLDDLRREAVRARDTERALAAQMAKTRENIRVAEAAEAAARQAQRDGARALEAARETLARFERRHAEREARLAALAEAEARLAANGAEARAGLEQAQAGLSALESPAALAQALDAARAAAALDRAELAETRGALRVLAGAVEARGARLAALAREIADWTGRQASAAARAEELAAREASAERQHAELAAAPETLLRQRRALMDAIDEAEAARRGAQDALAAAEAAQSESDRAARAAFEAMAGAREDNARAQAQVESRRQRLREIADAIDAELECAPHDLPALAGLAPHAPAPPRVEAEGKLERLRHERERLGAVNLRADVELAEIEAAKATLAGERADLEEAVKRLRQAIASLNREGRERLQAAFDVVDGHFRDLFTTLFGGGEAELQLVESDDPLEAGLEILARPPGKKPQTMTLLSGGEQALTAMALIFAVFLTNPSPICVLDEVDAPLDDANVERFCDLLEAMRQRTDTRFLTITHNPITMVRMDRLFGVTMAEQGVSQLVSVDLGEAERLAEAG